MKVFVWNRIEKCSSNYHSKGGVVVFAATESRAREIANQIEGCDIMPEEMPDYARKVTGKEEKVFIMPDAGCC